MQKGFSPILVVILIAAAVGGYFVYASLRGVPPKADDVAISPTISSTPKPTESTNSAETANWKTYNNVKMGFSIKYPIGILPYIEEDNDRVTISNVKPPIPVGAVPWHIYINFEENKNNLNVKTYVDSIVNTPEERKSINVGSVAAESVLGGFPGASLDRYVFIPYKEKFLVITMQPYLTGNTEDTTRHEVFNQILSTFKFIP